MGRKPPSSRRAQGSHAQRCREVAFTVARAHCILSTLPVGLRYFRGSQLGEARCSSLLPLPWVFLAGVVCVFGGAHRLLASPVRVYSVSIASCLFWGAVRAATMC